MLHFSYVVDVTAATNSEGFIEYSRTLIRFFEDFKFTCTTTKFYPKWLVRNFGQKHELQYLEKFAA